MNGIHNQNQTPSEMSSETGVVTNTSQTSPLYRHPSNNDQCPPACKQSIHVTRSDPLATESRPPRGYSRLKKRSSDNHHEPHSKERRARWIRGKMYVTSKPLDEYCESDNSPERKSSCYNKNQYYKNLQQYRTTADSGFQSQSTTLARRYRAKNSSENRDWLGGGYEGSTFHTSLDHDSGMRPYSFREQHSWNQGTALDSNRQRLRAGLSLPLQNTFESDTYGRNFLHRRNFEADVDQEDHEHEEHGKQTYLSRQTRLPYPYCNLRNHNTHDLILSNRSRSQSPCSITSESSESQGEKALDPPRLSIPNGGVTGAGGAAGGLTLGVGSGVIGGGYANNGRKLSVLFSSYDAWNEEHIVQSFKELGPTATSVFEAAWTGNLPALEDILSDSENLKTLTNDGFRDNDGRTPLHLASACGHVPCVQFLINKGANVNSCDSNEKATPLSCAASCGSVAVVEVLLNHGADINAGYEHGKTALHWAIQAGSMDCAKKLLEAGAKQNPPQVYSETPLHIAAALGDPDALQLLLDYGADVNLCKGTNRSTALHLSAEEGSAACVRLLLKAGASHTAKDIRGHSALHVAATCDADSVIALLKAGADSNAVDANGRTPLHCAVSRGSRAAECVRLLVESGADIDAQDNYGYTPLHLSAVNESSQCASILLHHGSDVTLKTNAGTNALSLLVRRIPDVMRYLVERLDSAVTIHDHDPADPDCEIRLDFRAIVPNCEKRVNGKPKNNQASSGGMRGSGGVDKRDYFQKPHRETEFLTCLVAAGNKKILAHPLSEAFLTLKWRRVRKFFWASLLFQIWLVALFTIYVVEVYLIRCPYRRHIPHVHPSVEPLSEDSGGTTIFPPSIDLPPFLGKNESSNMPTPPPAPNISMPENLNIIRVIRPPKALNLSRRKRSANPNPSGFRWFSFNPPKKTTPAPATRYAQIWETTTPKSIRGRGGSLKPPPRGEATEVQEDKEGTGRKSRKDNEEKKCKVIKNELNPDCCLSPDLQAIWVMLVAFASMMAIKEIFQLIQSPFSYVLSSENWGQWLLISSISVTAWTTPELDLYYWQYPAAACGIFLAWGLMLLQVGRFPALGLYVQMLGKVAANFGLFILAYACLLVAFALAFCVLFPEYPPYSSVVLSILKVFTMMVGEVDYEDLFYTDERLEDPILFPITAHLLYGAFVVIVTIVLMNLLVGLAVHDIQGLQKGAKLNRLSRQTALISRLESFIFSKRLQAALPRTVGSLLQKSALLVPSSYNWSYYFRPNDPRDKRLPKDIKLASLRLAASRHSSSKSKSHGNYHQHGGLESSVTPRPVSNISHHNSHHPEITTRRFEQRLDQIQNQLGKLNGRLDAVFSLLLEGKVAREENQGGGDNAFLDASTPTKSPVASPSPGMTVKRPSFPTVPTILQDMSCDKG